MKIAQVTIDGYYNYGNILQKYALHKTLQKFSDCTEVLWLTEAQFSAETGEFVSWTVPQNISTLTDRQLLFRLAVRFHKLKEFELRYIKTRFDIPYIEDLADDYDLFVVGSDQVWNPYFFVQEWYLPTVPSAKKFSYAASVATPTIPEQMKEVYKNLVSSFGKISVREIDAVKMLEDLTGKNVELVLDPVFLLTAEEWRKIYRRPVWLDEKYDRGYILTYMSNNFAAEVQALSNKLNLPVINLGDYDNYWHSSAAPEEFVYLIANATLFCTGSFHGTAFATLFRKNFVSYESGTGIMSLRIPGLLKMFGLEDRIANPENDYKISNLFETDFSTCDKVLPAERVKSFKFLTEAIQGGGGWDMKIEEMIFKKSSNCCGCSACANICPKKCISMERDAEGFDYPKINHEICIQCGRCDEVCPSLNFVEKIFDKVPAVYFAVNPDEKIRRHSSSGGVFSALSDLILQDDGIVFGAGFDENFYVKHMSAENLEELDNLRRSKYVQSQIGDTFNQVKKNLELGRKVLFTGTSCQCAGLKNFLGKDFANLLTVDVFCHGVPSPALWESYIDWRGRGHKISHVNFRNKRFGWASFQLQITFKDAPNYASRQDFFVQEFMMNLFLRPSCHDCKFRYPNVASDLSIGDAWGVQNFAPQLFDNRGISLVALNTKKSVDCLNRCKLLIAPAPFDIIIAANPNFLVQAVKDPRRENFFADLKESNSPFQVMQKYSMQDTSKISEDGWRKIQQLVQEKIQTFVQK